MAENYLNSYFKNSYSRESNIIAEFESGDQPMTNRWSTDDQPMINLDQPMINRWSTDDQPLTNLD